MKISVKAVSTRVSAISLGVRWRRAPSTSAIILSRKDSPGPAEMRTMIRSDSTVVPPVTPDRSPPASRMTGADSPVIAASLTTRAAFDHFAVAGNDLVRFDDDPVAGPQLDRGDLLDRLVGAQAKGRRGDARLAQRLGLRLAALLGDRGGEIGEQDGQPQPDVERDEIAERDATLDDWPSATWIT